MKSMSIADNAAGVDKDHSNKTSLHKEPSVMAMTACAAPVSATYFFYTPMWFILPGIYAKYFGLELTAVAAVVLYARLFDGITDPTIGYLSDRHRARNGSRKTWVLVGSIAVLIACYFLFSPPEQVTTTYYLLWTFAFFLAFTLVEIPHLSWGAELTMDYNRRAKVYSIRATFMALGQIAFFALPLLPIYASNEYTPETLTDAVYIGATIMLCGLVWSMFWAPASTVAKTPSGGDNITLFTRSLAQNKPLLLYYSATVCTGLSFGLWLGLLFFYLDGYLALGDKIATIFMLGNIAGLLSIPFWLKFIQKTSKSAAWAAGLTLFCTHLLGFLFVNPGGALWLPLLLTGTAYIGFSCVNASSLAVLGDIIDYGKLKFHQDRGGTYFAISSLLYKMTLGLGSGVSIGIAGIFDFDPTREVQSETALFGLQLGFIILPTLLGLVAVVLVLLTPINKHRHGIIQRRIASRPSSHSPLASTNSQPLTSQPLKRTIYAQ